MDITLQKSDLNSVLLTPFQSCPSHWNLCLHKNQSLQQKLQDSNWGRKKIFGRWKSWGPPRVPKKTAQKQPVDNTPLEISLILRGTLQPHSLAALSCPPAKSKACLPLEPGFLNCFLRTPSYFSLDQVQTLWVNKIKIPYHWQHTANCYTLGSFLLVNNSINNKKKRDLAQEAHQFQAPEELERTTNTHSGSSVQPVFSVQPTTSTARRPCA